MRYFETIFLEEAHDFIGKQNPKTRIKILYNIDRAAQCNDATLFKKLSSDIWEFRTLHAGIQIRLLAFWDNSKKNKTLVVSTHGFVKKVDKVPNREIERAISARKEYFLNQ